MVGCIVKEKEINGHRRVHEQGREGKGRGTERNVLFRVQTFAVILRSESFESLSDVIGAANGEVALAVVGLQTAVARTRSTERGMG